MTEQTSNGKPTISPERFLHEIGEVVGNLMLSRSQLWQQMLDKRRKVDDECDYPPTGTPVGVDLFKQLYEREPIAARVVEVLPRESWQSTPQIIDGSDSKDKTDFEEAVDELGRQLTPGGGKSWHNEDHGSPVWESLLRLDILSGIGQFGVMLLGIDDGLNLQDPVEGSVTVVPVANSDGSSSVVHMADALLSDQVYNDDSNLRKMEAKTYRKVWSHNERSRFKGANGTMQEGPAVPVYKDVEIAALNAGELATVEQWRQQTFVFNACKKAVERARSEFNCLSVTTNAEAVFASLMANSVDGDERRAVERWLSLADVARKRYDALPTENKTAAHFIDMLGGTDRQYFEAGAQGMGMSVAKGAYSVGTDTQYMGVQFGPSQAMVEKPIKKGHKLLFIRVYDESLVQVVRYEWNVNNPRFGMPVMYRITLNDPRSIHSGVGLPLATVFVHWSRVIHVMSDGGATTSETFGMPRMLQCLNRCLDLRKIPAAAGEGYWQSCFAAISLETHPQAGGDVKVDYAGLEQMMTDFRNRLRRDLILEGMAAKTLPPQVIDPSPFITAAIEAICIKIPCPKRVFMGSERGELASSQDDAQWNDVIRGRQQLHVTPRIIVPFFNRLILYGILPEPEDGYRVEWPDLDSLNDKDKGALALVIAQAISAYVGGNCQTIIPIKDFLLKAFSDFFPEEEVDAMIREAEKQQEEDLQEKQDLADEHGMIPEAPEGFQHPEPPAPPPLPIKVKDGERLVHPATVKGPPAPKPSGAPPAGKPPGAA